MNGGFLLQNSNLGTRDGISIKDKETQYERSTK